MLKEWGITKVTYDLIQNLNEEDRREVSNFVNTTFQTCLSSVIELMVEKEGKKGDTLTKDFLMR